MLDDATAPACPLCFRAFRADEEGRFICRLCERRAGDNLLALPGLYAQLDTTPGRGGDGPAVSGGGGSRPPLRFGVLTLMTEKGPVLAPLETWVRDWETYGHAELCEAGTLQQRVEHAVQTLRFNLDWAVHHHPAVDEFAKEVGKIHADCLVSVGAATMPRRVAVACEACGNILRVSLHMDGIECRQCQTRYDHQAMLNLTPTTRSVAA